MQLNIQQKNMNNNFTIKKINLKPKKFKISKKDKIIFTFILVVVILILTASYSALIAVNNWFNAYQFQFNKPVTIQLQKPIEVIERKVTILELVQKRDSLPEPKTDIEKYICEKWGIYDCKIALAIARAEGLKYDENGKVIPDLFNINTNGSMDVGVFQINSIHYHKPQCQLKDMVDPIKNVDCAYSIYEGSGWGAWSAFNNGSFEKHLKKLGL